MVCLRVSHDVIPLNNAKVRYHLTVKFTRVIDDPVFTITGYHYKSCKNFRCDLTLEQLLYITQNPLEYGRCGHISLHPVPEGRFMMRDNFVVAEIVDYTPHGCDSSSAITLKVDGPVHQSLKRAAKRIVSDVTLIHPYVQAAFTKVVILTESDTPFITQLIKCYINHKLEWEDTPMIAGEVSSIKLEDINSFIQPLRMIISEDVDLSVILRDDEQFMCDQRPGCIDKLVSHMRKCDVYKNKV